jgi:hypothetical protein
MCVCMYVYIYVCVCGVKITILKSNPSNTQKSHSNRVETLFFFCVIVSFTKNSVL